jgi:hypothetical protein
MLRQYLGSHKITFGKDKKAEENDTSVPDKKAIQIYLHGLKSQRSEGSQLDGDEEGQEEDDEEGEEEDEEEEIPPTKKTILKRVSVSLLLVCAILYLMIDRKNLRRHCLRQKRSSFLRQSHLPKYQNLMTQRILSRVAQTMRTLNLHLR